MPRVLRNMEAVYRRMAQLVSNAGVAESMMDEAARDNLTQAVHLHQGGASDQAAEFYRKVLRAEPRSCGCFAPTWRRPASERRSRSGVAIHRAGGIAAAGHGGISRQPWTCADSDGRIRSRHRRLSAGGGVAAGEGQCIYQSCEPAARDGSVGRGDRVLSAGVDPAAGRCRSRQEPTRYGRPGSNR